MEYENNTVIEVDENNLVVFVEEKNIPVTVQVLKETLGLLPGDRKGTRRGQRNTKSNNSSQNKPSAQVLSQSPINQVKLYFYQSDICAQVLFGEVEEFSSSVESEFSTLREIRIVTHYWRRNSQRFSWRVFETLHLSSDDSNRRSTQQGRAI